MSCSLFANMKLFVNIRFIFKVKMYICCIMKCSTLVLLEMIVLRSSMQGEDIIEHANGRCHVCTL